MTKPYLIVILDGWGYSETRDHNAIAHATTPVWDHLWQSAPHTLISAAGEYVGLPPQQMGNSEIGHTNIGAGRVVANRLQRINNAIDRGELATNPTYIQALQALHPSNTLHIMGLLSPGGVHSHEQHFYALLDTCKMRPATPIIRLHAFLDGRDTPPRSAEKSLRKMHEYCCLLPDARIASICGRYYAMDRDNRWERTEMAYRLLTQGIGEYSAPDPVDALQQAYQRGENDEFVKPTRIGEPAAIEDGDLVIFMNFRADRAKQITRAFIENDFSPFVRPQCPNLAQFLTMGDYDKNFDVLCAFPDETIHNSLGEYIGALGKTQLRIAETEKYAHVTFFFNGGSEVLFAGEERKLIPSPRVATYDLQPEMSAIAVTDHLVEAIRGKQYDLIICNYANGDMVGHTGNMDATIKAVETIDHCLGRVVSALRDSGGDAIITADHGNCEKMLDEDNQQPHTAHTCSLVPMIYVGDRSLSLSDGGQLSDLAPSILALMEIKQPAEMTGRSLIRLP